MIKDKETEHPLKVARRSGVPLLGMETADPAATVRECLVALNGESATAPIVSWDIVSGLVALNGPGRQVLTKYDPLAMQLPDIFKMLAELELVRIVCFVHNAQRFLDRDGVAQGVWLLRDPWKSAGSTLILLGPVIKLPAELAADVIVFPVVSPGREAIDAVVGSLVNDALSRGAKIPADYPRERVVDGLNGLASLFDVEQTLALNIRKDRIDVDGVWQLKIARIKEQTGAEIKIGCPKFEALAGCSNVKSELSGFISGRQRPGVVLFMDEVEKAFGGAGTDLSGVSTAMLGQWLSWTQDNRVRGFLLAGIPGAGKTWTGECAAGEAGVPFFKLSMQDMKGSLVGESESKLRAALAAVTALAAGAPILMIASANWIDQLTPDVMGRFSMGTFFYDFPSDSERSTLWKMYMERYGLDDTAPESKGWVGREIETACWRAWQYQRKLVDVAKNIAPSCISQKDRLDKLRKSCAGRFLSANLPGLFDCQEMESDLPMKKSAGRVMKF